jgi:hypothetical protein
MFYSWRLNTKNKRIAVIAGVVFFFFVPNLISLTTVIAFRNIQEHIPQLAQEFIRILLLS